MDYWKPRWRLSASAISNDLLRICSSLYCDISDIMECIKND